MKFTYRYRPVNPANRKSRSVRQYFTLYSSISFLSSLFFFSLLFFSVFFFLKFPSFLLFSLLITSLSLSTSLSTNKFLYPYCSRCAQRNKLLSILERKLLTTLLLHWIQMPIECEIYVGSETFSNCDNNLFDNGYKDHIFIDSNHTQNRPNT